MLGIITLRSNFSVRNEFPFGTLGRIARYATTSTTNNRPPPSLLVQQLEAAGIRRAPWCERPVYIPFTIAEASRAIDILRASRPIALGFDTETTVYRKKSPGIISLIQLATPDACFMIQIFRITDGDRTLFPPILATLLNSSIILKVGCKATDDAVHLETSYGVRVRGAIDIEMLARAKGFPVSSLAEMSQIWGGEEGVLIKPVDVKERKKLLKWNFDAGELTDEVVEYSSRDAFMGLQIFINILHGRENTKWVPYNIRFPMTNVTEMNDVWEFLVKRFRRQPKTIQTLLQVLRANYPRFQKSMVEPDLTQCILVVLRKFVAEGRLLPTKSTPSLPSGDSAPQPSSSASQPSISAPQPSISASQPSISAPQPSISAPQPSISAPQPSISAPQPYISDVEFLAQTYQISCKSLKILLSELDPDVLRCSLPQPASPAEDIVPVVIDLAEYMELPTAMALVVQQVVKAAKQRGDIGWSEEWVKGVIEQLIELKLVEKRSKEKVLFDEKWVVSIEALVKKKEE
ncbi:ribonuclease H-like domain-containing protein [Jimgerdemannia flammicorona]|uniref:Ribonuclease H-like domain-containing protein n=1 Tax=Jimgerdemannia flammicorona TaxID=994334 RepID=A0A433DEU3_9FUNG|nr:ribonuclease H-like domain-containing protein [Jimgerdemannia flammicorona]